MSAANSLLGDDPDDLDMESARVLVPPTPRLHPGCLVLIVLFVAGTFTGLFLLGFLPYKRRESELLQQTERARLTPLRVTVIKPKPTPSATDALLPGTVQPWQETTLYARVNGYVKRWLVDIGDDVQEGQLVAEIETPEVDQELRQAQAAVLQLRARLATATANVGLAVSSLERYRNASARGGISLQEFAERQATLDTAKSSVDAAKADIVAGEANVGRLTETKTFARVIAPFAGTVTQRDIEIGTLVNPTRPLFRIAQTDRLRVFVHVPQFYASQVAVGHSAVVTIREAPNVKLAGKVTRTSRSLDPASRTLLTEIQVSNTIRLLPGVYAQVRLTLSRATPAVLIPGSALVFAGNGTQVAVLTAENKVHFKTVEVEADYGADLGISSGLTSTDDVITDPGGRLVEGLVVEKLSPPAAPR